MVRLTVSAVAFVALLAACVSSTTIDTAAFTKPAMLELLATADRSDADRARDDTRKPYRVLPFFELKPGMTVLDLYSGGGYYTEIVSRAVGPHGIVHTHNNKAYLAYAKDEIEARYKNNRLSNVVRIKAENNELDFAPQTYDMVLMILAYHDIYYVDEENDWPAIDGPKLLAELYASLKPGAVLGVVDHAATAGAPAEAGQTLHRIDPQRALREIEAAGFVHEASSEMLANPNDQHDKPMFAPEVKGKTDRFVYRFRKP